MMMADARMALLAERLKGSQRIKPEAEAEADDRMKAKVSTLL